MSLHAQELMTPRAGRGVFWLKCDGKDRGTGESSHARGGEGDCLSVWPLLSPLALDKNLI